MHTIIKLLIKLQEPRELITVHFPKSVFPINYFPRRSFHEDPNTEIPYYTNKYSYSFLI